MFPSTFLFVDGSIHTNKFESVRIREAQKLKGIDRPFGGGVESILIRSVFVNWRLGYFFLSYFKGPSSQDQQKTIVRRLITSKVTLTGQSHFMLIFVLRKATLPNRINSVP